MTAKVKRSVGVALAAAFAPVAASAADSLSFALRLYRAVAAQPGSACVSPYSVRQVLEMAQEGARGETAEEFERVVGPGEGAPLAPSNSEDLKLAEANALWADQRFPVRPEYVAEVERQFRAEAADLDFGEPAAAAERINSWVAGHTEGRIPRIVSPEAVENASVVLTNAVYFKAKWEHAFSPGRTQNGPFHVSSSATITVPMMHETATAAWMQTDSAQLVQLPYRTGEFAMVIVLPDRIDGLPRLESTLKSSRVRRWFSTLDAEEGVAEAPPGSAELPRSGETVGAAGERTTGNPATMEGQSSPAPDSTVASPTNTAAGADGSSAGSRISGHKDLHEIQVALPKFEQRSSFDLSQDLKGFGLSHAFSAEIADFSGISPVRGLHIDRVFHKTFVHVDESGTEAAAATAGVMTLALVRVEQSFVADHPFLYFIREVGTDRVLFIGRMVNPAASSSE